MKTLLPLLLIAVLTTPADAGLFSRLFRGGPCANGRCATRAKAVIQTPVKVMRVAPIRTILYRGRVFRGCSRASCVMCNTIRSGRQWPLGTRGNVTIQGTVIPSTEDRLVLRSTPHSTVEGMISFTPLRKDQLIIDLGSGDARVLIAAVLKYGCRGLGLELNKETAEKSRYAIEAVGLSDRITIISQDVTTYDLGKADYVTVFLDFDTMEDIRFDTLKPGSLVVSQHEIPHLSNSISIYGEDRFYLHPPVASMANTPPPLFRPYTTFRPSISHISVLD